MEGRNNKKRKKDRKEEGIHGKGGKKKKKSSAGLKQVRLLLLVFLSVKKEGVGACIYSPVVQLPFQFLRVLLLPSRPLFHQLFCP